MRGKSLVVLVILLSLSGCAFGGRPTPEPLANNTFAECPGKYQQTIQQRLSANLIDPSSAMFRFSIPEKYIYDGQYGQFVVVGLNAKNRYGAYMGEEIHHFMCFPDSSVQETNEFATGMAVGFQRAGY